MTVYCYVAAEMVDNSNGYRHSSLMLNGKRILVTRDRSSNPGLAILDRDIPSCSEITELMKRVSELIDEGHSVQFDVRHFDNWDECYKFVSDR